MVKSHGEIPFKHMKSPVHPQQIFPCIFWGFSGEDFPQQSNDVDIFRKEFLKPSIFR